MQIRFIVTLLAFGALSCQPISGASATTCDQADAEEAAGNVSLLERWAANGNACANQSLGRLYFQGRTGLKADPQKALKYEQAAANSGLASAQFELGLFLLGGRGINANYDQAVKWLTAAADNGYTPAQFALGQMNLTGYGVERNLRSGFAWLLRADEGGDLQAHQMLESMAGCADKLLRPDQPATP